MTKPNWRKAGQNSQPPKPPGPENRLVTTSFSGLASESSDFSSNPYDSTAVVFFDVCSDFAKASSDVWSTDKTILEEYQKLLALASESFEVKREHGAKLAKTFHQHFVKHYPDVVKKNPDFFSLPPFSKVNGRKKFDLASAGIQNTVWEYFKQLVQYAGMIDMYSKCPPGMLASISGIAGGLITKLQGGEMDLNSLNPIQLGQMMIKDMNPDDLEGFGNAILEGGNIDSMMSIMQSTLGGMGGGHADMISKMFEKM